MCIRNHCQKAVQILSCLLNYHITKFTESTDFHQHRKIRAYIEWRANLLSFIFSTYHNKQLKLKY